MTQKNVTETIKHFKKSYGMSNRQQMNIQKTFVFKKRESQERRNKLKKCKAMKHPNEVNHT